MSLRLLTTATETKENSPKVETNKGEKEATATETEPQLTAEVKQLKEVQDKLQKQLDDFQVVFLASVQHVL